MREAGARDRYGHRWLLLLIVLFVAAMLPLVLSLNVWQDETYSLRTTSGDFAHAFRSAIVFEGLPPFYPLLLECWRALDRSVVFARLLSVLFAAATIWCGWLFAKRTLPNVPPLAFAFALAADPFLIYAALDIRLYALAVLLSGLLFLTFFDGFFAERPSRRAQYAHAVLAIVGMYTQYFIGALLLGFFIALLLARRRKAIGEYVVLGFVVTLASLPIASFLREQLATFRTSSDVVHYSASSVIVTAFTFALPHDWLPQWTHGAGNTIYWIAIAAAAVATLVARPRFGAVLGALATIAFVVVVFFLTVPIALHQTLIVPRHLAVLLFPVLALVFAIFDRLRAGRDRALAVYLCAYAIFAVLAFVATYARDAKPGDFKHAAAYLESNERPGQTIYVYDQEMTTP
ncbi:MAG: glycosyltransferase family 39 protein, partial [Candidatus Eremiobacteraeota bacterium]|nr:glycosyltransferase family 39 protein [Candidatus Eremiobacteraeota bacterium]